MQAQTKTSEHKTLIWAPPSALPEGTWNWVELHVRASVTFGEALTELEINGVSQGVGASPVANRFPGRSNWNRFRAGLVSAGNEPGPVAVDIDRMSISPTELGPAEHLP